MIYVEEHVKGLAELDGFLATLTDQIQRKMLASSLRQAGKPVLEQARTNVRALFGSSVRYTGVLEQGVVIAKARRSVNVAVNIKTRKPRGTKGKERINGVLKPYGRDPFYGRFLEKGTSRMAARPFLGPAAYARQTDSGRALNAALQKQVEKWCKANGVKYVPGAI
jgi:HK97 gp10 family phage protein